MALSRSSVHGERALCSATYLETLGNRDMDYFYQHLEVLVTHLSGIDFFGESRLPVTTLSDIGLPFVDGLGALSQ